MKGYRMEPQEHIQDLRAISEGVADYLDRQLYMEEYGPGDYTVSDIITSCYAIAFSDLDTIGIHTTKEVDDILTDFYICKDYYYLLKTFHPDGLLSYLNKPEVIDKVETLLTDMADNFLIQAVIDVLNDFYPDSFELKHLLFIQDELVNDDVFITYLTNTCKKIKAGDYLIPTPSGTAAQQYLYHMNLKRHFVTSSVSRILRYPPIEGKIDNEYLNKQMREYDLDKTSPENLALFSKVDKEPCPDYLKPIKQLADDAHHIRTPHHIEYWITNKAQVIPKEAIILLVATLFEPDDWESMDLTKYHGRIKTMIAKAKDIFTQEDIDFIWAIADYPADRGIDITD